MPLRLTAAYHCYMATITNVSDLDQVHRTSLEAVVGRKLDNDQVIQIDATGAAIVIKIIQVNKSVVPNDPPYYANVAPTDFEDGWSDDLDNRRLALIAKRLNDSLTEDETQELASLQMRANDHYDQVAPPPTDAARDLLKKLTEESKASKEAGEDS